VKKKEDDTLYLDIYYKHKLRLNKTIKEMSEEEKKENERKFEEYFYMNEDRADELKNMDDELENLKK